MGSEFSLVCRGATIRYRRFGQGPALLYLRSEDSLPDSPVFLETLSIQIASHRPGAHVIGQLIRAKVVLVCLRISRHVLLEHLAIVRAQRQRE